MGGEDIAEAKAAKDYCLVLVNLLEALQDALQDVRSYRTHCAEFVAAAQRLRPGLNEVLAAEPAFGYSKEAREGLKSLINLLQDGLAALRKCSQLTGLAKMLDHGNLRTRLEELIAFVNQDVSRVEAFLKLSVSRAKSQKKAEKLQALRQGNAHVAFRQ